MSKTPHPKLLECATACQKILEGTEVHFAVFVFTEAENQGIQMELVSSLPEEVVCPMVRDILTDTPPLTSNVMSPEEVEAGSLDKSKFN